MGNKELMFFGGVCKKVQKNETKTVFYFISTNSIITETKTPNSIFKNEKIIFEIVIKCKKRS